MDNNYEDRSYIERINLTDVNEILSAIHGQRYIDYRKEWDNVEERKGYVAENPLQFVLELSNSCNLRCKCCVRSVNVNKQPHQEVPMEMIDRLVFECKELGIPAIGFGNECEPTLHSHFKEVVEKFNSISVDLWTYSNGVNLTEDLAEFLIEQQVERLPISLDAATPETYKIIRGGVLEKVEKNIENFLRIREMKNSKLPILRLSFVKMPENLHEIEMFYEKWKDKADLLDFQDLINYSNINNPVPIDVEPFVCSHPFARLSMTYDGKIYPCCDFHGRHHVLGNIKDMTLKEAWNCDKMKRLRESFMTKKVTPACQNCYGNLSNTSNVADMVKNNDK